MKSIPPNAKPRAEGVIVMSENYFIAQHATVVAGKQLADYVPWKAAVWLYRGWGGVASYLSGLLPPLLVSRLRVANLLLIPLATDQARTSWTPASGMELELLDPISTCL